MLSGHKTYIVAGLMAIASALYGLGVIDADAWKTLMGLLNGAAAVTLRAGIAHDTKAKG